MVWICMLSMYVLPDVASWSDVAPTPWILAGYPLPEPRDSWLQTHAAEATEASGPENGPPHTAFGFPWPWGYPQSSSILVGVSLINQPFGNTPNLGNPQLVFRNCYLCPTHIVLSIFSHEAVQLVEYIPSDPPHIHMFSLYWISIQSELCTLPQLGFPIFRVLRCAAGDITVKWVWKPAGLLCFQHTFHCISTKYTFLQTCKFHDWM